MNNNRNEIPALANHWFVNNFRAVVTSKSEDAVTVKWDVLPGARMQMTGAKFHEFGSLMSTITAGLIVSAPSALELCQIESHRFERRDRQHISLNQTFVSEAKIHHHAVPHDGRRIVVISGSIVGDNAVLLAHFWVDLESPAK